MKCGKGENLPIYFYTEDNPTKGPHQVNALGVPFEAVPEPAAVKAVIAIIGDIKWKLTQYYDASGAKATGILNELYNLTVDPIEVENLYGSGLEVQNTLTVILNNFSFIY